MRRLILVLVSFAVLWPIAPSFAQAPTDPKVCAALDDDAERLACYDGIFKVAPQPPAGTSIEIASKQLIPARPSGRGFAMMTVDCVAGSLGVRFSFAGQILSETGDDAGISFQVQQTGNVVRNLPVSPNNQSIVFPSSADGDAFLESIEGGDSLIVRITPPRQRSIQAEFPLKAHEEEIGRIRELCRS